MENLVLGGGGIRGAILLGYLDSIYDDLINIKTISGTSVGAVIALLLICKMTPFQIKESMKKHCLMNSNNWDLQLFETNYGIEDGSCIIQFLESLIGNPTFIDLFNKTNKTLIINGFNVSCSKLEYFNHILTPDMPVLTAISISTRIPLYYSKFIYNNNIYIDGSVVDPVPVNCIENVNKDNTLIVVLKSSMQEPDSIFNYIELILESLITYLGDKNKKDLKCKTLNVNKCKIIDPDYTDDYIDELFKYGQGLK